MSYQASWLAANYRRLRNDYFGEWFEPEYVEEKENEEGNETKIF